MPPIDRWVGIDEAGYGPNLGPLVMTAVIAEGPEGVSNPRRPDVWADLAHAVARAGDRSKRLWVDDSKQILKARGKGRDRLEATCHALARTVSGASPASLGGLLKAFGAGDLDDVELSLWANVDPVWPCVVVPDSPCPEPFSCQAWRVSGVRMEVVGPARFERELRAAGSKAVVHFAAFSKLLRHAWETTPAGGTTVVRGDKHGGRHFYHELLMDLFPEAWVDRGEEGPELSHYTVRAGDRRLELSLVPRADADDGLVALASIASKSVREAWMDAFNAFWLAKVPGLRPTAGYPVDAARFRQAIEPECDPMGLDPELWWRSK